MNFVKFFIFGGCLASILSPAMVFSQDRFSDSPYRQYWEGQMQWTAEKKRPTAFRPQYQTRTQTLPKIEPTGSFPVEASAVQRIYRLPVEPNTIEVAPKVEPAPVVVPTPVVEVVEPESEVRVVPATKPLKETVLFVAPHPDDEILCCARTIAQKKAAGYEVKVLYITNGDAYELGGFDRSKDYATARKNESLDAIELLGVPVEDTYWLNFPDSQLENLGDEVLVSPFTGQDRSGEESFYPNSPYTQTSLIFNISQVLVDAEPIEIYLPNPDTDIHPDHRVAGEIFAEILDPLASPPARYFYQVHGAGENQDHAEHGDIVDTEKLKLIRQFKTQYHDADHELFMDGFAKKPERFIKH